MSWYSKEAPTPFDNSQIEGVFFLDGNILARLTGYRAVEGQKYPQIEFPSGLTFDIWESSEPEDGIVHLYGCNSLCRHTAHWRVPVGDDQQARRAG